MEQDDKIHSRESNPLLLRRNSAGLPLNLPRVTQGVPWPLGGLSTQWRDKWDFEAQEENAEVPQEGRGQGERLWRRENHSQPCAEPGRAHPWNYPNTTSRNCLWNRPPCSSGASNQTLGVVPWILGKHSAVCLGRDGETEDFFTLCPIPALLAQGQVEAGRFWEGKQQPGTYGSGSRVSFFFFSNWSLEMVLETKS